MAIKTAPIKCHCGSDAHKYRTREFTNQLGYKVIRTFYRCENCWSRIPKDEIPELTENEVSVFDLIKKTTNEQK